VTASKSYNTQTTFVSDMKTFTELKNAQSITIAYDGLNPMPPMFCYLKPYYNDVNKSYFRQMADGEVWTLASKHPAVLTAHRAPDRDASVSEIMVNGSSQVFIERAGVLSMSRISR